MNIKVNDLKKLAELTFENGETNKNVAEFVLNKLTKKELKTYLILLRQELLKKRIFVRASKNVSDEMQRKLQRIFKEKEIILEKDESVGAGLFLQVNDNIINLTIENFIDQTIDSLNKSL